MIALRVQPVPSLLLYDFPRLVKLDPAARTIGNVRRRWLIVVIFVDAEWWFSRSDPCLLKVGVWFLNEWKNIICQGGFRDIGYFTQAGEFCELSRRDSIGKMNFLLMYEGVIDLESVSGSPERSTSLQGGQHRQLTSEPDSPRSKRSTPPNSLSSAQ